MLLLLLLFLLLLLLRFSGFAFRILPQREDENEVSAFCNSNPWGFVKRTWLKNLISKRGSTKEHAQHGEISCFTPTSYLILKASRSTDQREDLGVWFIQIFLNTRIICLWKLLLSFASTIQNLKSFHYVLQNYSFHYIVFAKRHSCRHQCSKSFLFRKVIVLKCAFL